MEIKFQFDIKKAVSATFHVLSKLGPTDKAKLLKLLYIADRDCFVLHGHPITRDSQYAMKYGPVPSACLDTINGNFEEEGKLFFRFFHVVDDKVSQKTDAPRPPALSNEELEVLDGVLTEHGKTPTWTLVGQTHAYPEYREVYKAGTSQPIPYEIILKHHGSEDQFRHDRPVISKRIAAHIQSPFYRSETDL